MSVILKPNILLVDDNNINLILLETILKKLDINIIKANSGKEALAKMEGVVLALALVDIQMPQMTGIEFAKFLHKDKNRQKFPIIFITAYYDSNVQLLEGYEAGAVDYLLKPVNPTILLSKIKVFLELAEQKNQLADGKNKMQAIYENIPGGIMVIDSNYIIQEVNETTCRITGYKKEELIGQLCDKVCPLVPASKRCPVKANDQTGYKEMDTTITGIDGKKHPILKNAKQVQLDGETYILEIFQDISELKSAEAIVIESEKKYRTLVEQSLEGIVVVTDSQIVFANESFIKMTGYTSKELVNLSEKQIASVIDLKLMNSLSSKATNNSKKPKGKTKSSLFEYKGFRKNGSECWFQISANSIVYEGKTAIQGTIIDNSERKLAEEALAKTENKYQVLLDASPEGILIIDLTGRIIEVSGITSEIFAAKNKYDLIGKHFLRLIHKESRKKVREVIEKTISEGLEQDTEFILTKTDNKQFIGEVSTTLVQENNGMPRLFMAIVRDISERKKIEKQLIHTERMAGLGEMATGIAHEINQPLNTISMSLENMLVNIAKNKNQQQHFLNEKINKIFDNIYRISKIIDHIRAFSRDRDDQIPTTFNINESIRDAISMVNVQYKHKAIDIITELSDNLPPVAGNTFGFEQVMLNLIINAKDALEEKELVEHFDKEIIISTYLEKNDIITIEISDNGMGIKYEDMGNIMLPFYSTKEVGKGTGVGLSVSFGIIKEMKGNIDIQSEVLKGTTMCITMPVNHLQHK